jgi:xylulokinase
VLDRPFDRLVVAGGGARSTLMLQILAGVFDLRTARMTTTDGAGTGAAICAAVGSGVHSDWEAATAAMVHASETVEPDPAEVTAYREVRAVHDVVTRHLGPMLREARG